MELKFEDIYELEKLRNGYIKDEYHTISKLYFNRMILFMYLCKAYKNKAWKSKFHDDNSMFVVGITHHKDFISLFGAILRMRNLLCAFVEFEGKEMVSERDLQDYS